MTPILSALQLSHPVDTVGNDELPSCFAVTDLATSAIGAVGSAVAGLLEDLNLVANRPGVQVDQRLASLWFAQSIHPIGWKLPPLWDAIAGDYRTKDGWIKLHTNLDHHRAAAISVLETKEVREEVEMAVSTWCADDLEAAIIQSGGVAAAMRSRGAWRAHPQGKAVASEPLVAWSDARAGRVLRMQPSRLRPLNGLRVLDLTRVLAGPVCTRTLAGFGAQILRIDPPGWDEPNVVPDITLGKCCCTLELNQSSDREIFEELLSSADLLIHGYRPDALDRLGYGEDARLQVAPNLIEISLDAYGWTGPWSKRRGFDSLVQMSCGIADAGMRWANREQPTPLPVQALDHATGYLMAAAAVRAVSFAANGDGLRAARLSLARTGELLVGYPQNTEGKLRKEPRPGDFMSAVEHTPWGRANRLKPALAIEGTPMEWKRAASELGSSIAQWCR